MTEYVDIYNYLLMSLDSTESAINVEYAVISVLVLCEEDRRIRHLSRISESM